MQVDKLLEHYRCSFISKRHNKTTMQVDKLLQHYRCRFSSQKRYYDIFNIAHCSSLTSQIALSIIVDKSNKLSQHILKYTTMLKVGQFHLGMRFKQFQR